MNAFIWAVLITASVQSFSKLSLLPRRWAILCGAVLSVLPFIFADKIQQMSMMETQRLISGAELLELWCTMVVTQELLVIVIGFSLLADLQNRKKWKYAAFLPSILLPFMVLYGQMFLFNRFPAVEADKIVWFMALGVPAVLYLISEGLRLWRRKVEERILTVLHLEYLLLITAIFMPVAATAKLMDTPLEWSIMNTVAVVGGLAGCVLLSALGWQIWAKIKKRRRYIKCQI